jgi:hypothetical protein
MGNDENKRSGWGRQCCHFSTPTFSQGRLHTEERNERTDEGRRGGRGSEYSHHCLHHKVPEHVTDVRENKSLNSHAARRGEKQIARHRRHLGTHTQRKSGISDYRHATRKLCPVFAPPQATGTIHYDYHNSELHPVSLLKQDT